MIEKITRWDTHMRLSRLILSTPSPDKKRFDKFDINAVEVMEEIEITDSICGYICTIKGGKK